MPRFKPLPKGRRVTEYEEVVAPKGGGEDRSLPELSSRPPAPVWRRRVGEPPECWRVSRVARHLDVSRKRIYQLVYAGKLEGVRMGPRGLRVVVPSIEAYLRRRRTK